MTFIEESSILLTLCQIEIQIYQQFGFEFWTSCTSTVAAVAKRETTANSTSLNSGYAGHQLETLPLAVHQSWQTIGGLDWRSLQKLTQKIRWSKKKGERWSGDESV